MFDAHVNGDSHIWRCAMRALIRSDRMAMFGYCVGEC